MICDHAGYAWKWLQVECTYSLYGIIPLLVSYEAYLIASQVSAIGLSIGHWGLVEQSLFPRTDPWMLLLGSLVLLPWACCAAVDFGGISLTHH